MTGRHFCPCCGSRLRDTANFCASCGKPITGRAAGGEAGSELPGGASTKNDSSGSSARARIVMSKRARLLYAALAAAMSALFLLIFARHLPGGENAVIAGQPEVPAAASIQPDEIIKPEPITAEVHGGRITFPLPELVKKRLVQFEYRSAGVTIPVIAFITGEGKLVTAVAICEPCNSHSFRIEGTELACGNCETRWKLDNLEGIQGSCQKYPPAPIPSVVVGNEVQIDESLLKYWKLRI